MRWRPFAFNGKIYDLSQLHPRSCCYLQAAKAGKPERFYNGDIIFSLHCLTRVIAASQTPNATVLYADDREQASLIFSGMNFPSGSRDSRKPCVA